MQEPLNLKLSEALTEANDTKSLSIGHGAISELPRILRRYFRGQRAVIVADENTWRAAGDRVHKILLDVGLSAHHDDHDRLILDSEDLHAEMRHVEAVQSYLESLTNHVAIAVGGGTINDLVKLAVSQLGRSYVCVATAASVDGFGAYSASIEVDGHKQTIYCPAPLAVVADLDVICRAPKALNAAGYGDLLAKYVSGIDWIFADAAGVEAIDEHVWGLTRDEIDLWTGKPKGVNAGDSEPIRNLFNGLIMQGIAMDVYQDTRPCSGAEHQFSHNLDMIGHRYHGEIPYHGMKVGIGSIAMTKLQEKMLAFDPSELDIDKRLADWMDKETATQRGQDLFEQPKLKEVVGKEYPKKHMNAAEARVMIDKLITHWPETVLRAKPWHLGSAEYQARLKAAGCPIHPEEIGVSLDFVKSLYFKAYHTRARFTALDVAVLLGKLHDWVDEIFNEPW
ncbi:Glycerol-1-phosphate dehydrogenase [NAD(P)+] [Poriferisphaera corsica]|uniref:Glycerol-1-phosphate dehydrogenase [NAD(P)+] n=1 Tax=Poriferisphaera corsica TaxID=2528020 RepID=A0A517YVZ0_9BACT|nr:sn-glycerol-1-phosphate dehydrogenase [Poriferisphaera corsica]QDU34401.1 Glycerol-1-phosphate dehydrogenase [NAD(P)+] [Poriferisphaera corsica]